MLQIYSNLPFGVKVTKFLVVVLIQRVKHIPFSY